MKSFKKIVIVLGLVSVFTFGVLGCEDTKRFGKSVKSSFTGIDRVVKWTGFDGSTKTWEGNFKIESNQDSPTVYFITDEGKTVILGPGWYSEER